MSDLLQRRTALLLSAAIVALAVAGAFQHHSPVPYWDMWNGYLQFYMNATDGMVDSWWAQHNEHRIVLARLLFFIDIAWFDGLGYFLIATQLLMIAAAAALWISVLRDQAAGARRSAHRTPRFIFACANTAALFLWMQHENLTWAFQSQFFLVQLLPLAALICLYRSDDGARATWLFVAACALGVASAVTMANGVLALPLLMLTAIVLRHGSTRILLLAIASAVTLVAYFATYQSPPGHGSIVGTLTTMPFQFVRYVLRYLGAPVFHLMDGGAYARSAAVIAGAVLCLLTAWRAWKILPLATRHKPTTAVLAYLAYLIATAAATAGGRAMFGADQALSSRYATPALMAWVAVAVIYAPVMLNATVRRAQAAGVVALAALTGLLAAQTHAVLTHSGTAFEREVSALALAMTVHDTPQIKKVFPAVAFVQNTARQAAARGISIFAQPPYRDVSKHMGTSQLLGTFATCKAGITHIDTLADDPDHVKVAGWIEHAASVDLKAASLANADKRIVGWVMIDPATRVLTADSANKRASFSGYARTAEGVLTSIGDRDDGVGCSLAIPADIALR
ncbi:hypothetical protein [Schauerella aestuarii]|uniref:hypothetical protein n=1 Tax=Schauerella aestuarii TaxID=2511204 RepID=UPI00136F50F1|nr:hypothetical protein [Achromobacter aestuarii]MYZ43694.1 hypothetical protein [Achromobacter aestuarii]